MAFELLLYIAELEDDKYYVGQSKHPDFRFKEHLAGKGAKWTKLHTPLRQLAITKLTIESERETMLYENWHTLKQMERFGWQNVRGGDFLVTDDHLLAAQIEHIYDLTENRIKYYVNDNRFIFGKTQDWLVFVLECEDKHFYIGSCKQLGKALGEHFSGQGIIFTRDHPVISVVEIFTITEDTKSLKAFKDDLRDRYIERYGWDSVMAAEMPKKPKAVAPFTDILAKHPFI
ncbi:MAG TPA: GIY-YIG nuclease family protein [Mucilaginibacter sp.]|jgi:predicted GIY-YIG superfamily endonuclease